VAPPLQLTARAVPIFDAVYEPTRKSKMNIVLLCASSVLLGASSSSVTTAKDWRNANGTSMLTPVLSQLVPKSCDSACAAHAHVSYLSDSIKVMAARADPTVGRVSGGDVILSVQALINCVKPNTDSCSVGGSHCVDYLKDNGISDETCSPSLGEQQACAPINTCYYYSPDDKKDPHPIVRGNVPLWGVSASGSLPAYNISAMQKEILDNGPIHCSSAVPDGIMQEYSGGVINNATHPGWCTQGAHGHTLSIIGWGSDPTDGDYWAVRTRQGHKPTCTFYYYWQRMHGYLCACRVCRKNELEHGVGGRRAESSRECKREIKREGEGIRRSDDQCLPPVT
jgi:hypothetical protein